MLAETSALTVNNIEGEIFCLQALYPKHTSPEKDPFYVYKATADPDTIILGETVQLDVDHPNNNEVYTYKWSPEGSLLGNNPTEDKSPEAMPDTDTDYQVVVTDENGTVIALSQNVGHATDFHARTFDRPSSVSALGLNSSWQANPKLLLEFDVSSSKASTEDRVGAGNALTLIGYLNRSSFSMFKDQILPHISDFESSNPTVLDALGNITCLLVTPAVAYAEQVQ